jgi:hypothetical protein
MFVLNFLLFHHPAFLGKGLEQRDRRTWLVSFEVVYVGERSEPR